jgi:hypothetical protein
VRAELRFPRGTRRGAAGIVRLPPVLRDIAVLVAVFVVVSVIAGLLGAANLGTALSFGTIAFATVLVGIMLYRDRDA